MKDRVYYISEDDMKEFLEMYIDKCYNLNEIAEWFGVDRKTVENTIKALSLKKAWIKEKYLIFAEFLENCKHIGKTQRRKIEKAKRRLGVLEKNAC